MQVDLTELRKVLERVKLGIGNGSVITWLGDVGFSGSTATVWNGSFGIIYKNAMDGEFSVNHERLFSIVKAYKSDEATCTIADGKLILKSKKQIASLGVNSLEDFTFPKPEEVIEIPLEPHFIKALEIASVAMPKTVKGPSFFQGVSFGATNGRTRLLAYDGKRYAFVWVELSSQHTFIVNQKAVDALLKLGNPNSYGVGKQFIYFFYNDIIVFFRPMDAKESKMPDVFFSPVCDLTDVDSDVPGFIANAKAMGAETVDYNPETKQLKALEKHGDSLVLDVDLSNFASFRASVEILNESLGYAGKWGMMTSPNGSTVIVLKPMLDGYIYISGMREE